MVLVLAGFSCSSAGDEAVRSGGGAGGAKSALVDWPAVPQEIAKGDAAIMAEALSVVKSAAAARAIPLRQGSAAGSILVVVLDTVRADHLGVYGYDRHTTPKLDAWAESAHVWDHAWTDAPWTLPAHASMFTGKSQREHGARSLGHEDDRKGAPLAESEVTIAERLRDVGYGTVGIAGNRAFLHPSFGLSQGFDAWVNAQPKADPRKVPYTPADRIAPMALAALAQADEHPLFLFVNFMDAHTPYKARRGYVREPELLKRGSIPGNKGFKGVAKRLLEGAPLAPGVQRSWIEAYDAELRFLDEHLALVLAAASSFDHVFVLSDHGEYLGEHGLVEHAKDVYEPVVHVPFLAKGASFEPGHDASAIQTHDLAWMVLEAAGLSTDGTERTGELAVSDLYYTLKKDLDAPTYGSRFNRIRRAFRVGSDKLIVGTDGSVEVYNLAEDPEEVRPGSTLPPRFEGLEAAWLSAHPEVAVVPPGGALGPDEAALKALGYAE